MVEHPTLLRGAGIAGAAPRPVILQRKDQEFLPAILEELRTGTGQAKLRATVASERDAGGVLRLYQPVHRTFHVVLLEAVCDRFPEPRLDPARIESAGLVIRRLRGQGEAERAPRQGWIRTEFAIRGWIPIVDGDERLDPDPARRRPALRAGHAEVTRRLPQRPSLLDGCTETVSPLFVAPPDVCAAAGRTLLYGVIPLASGEQTEVPADAGSGYDLEEARAQLPAFMRRGSHQLDPGDEESDEAVVEGLTLLASLATQRGDDAAAFFGRFDVIRIHTADHRDAGLGAVLRSAATVFDGAEAPRLATSYHWWISEEEEDRLAAELRGLLQSQMAGMTAGMARYAQREGRYELRAFMRARVCDPCPPELVWSEPSEPFSIVPWYESGGNPPVQVPLPDVTSPAALKKLRPDVAFVAPDVLFKRVRSTKLKDLIAGNVSPPGAEPSQIDIICGFNIPIITICALIVLYIFLSLLHLIFRWLPYVIICLPLPRRWPKLR